MAAHCFFGSRRARLERTDLSCGPFRLGILERGNDMFTAMASRSAAMMRRLPVRDLVD